MTDEEIFNALVEAFETASPEEFVSGHWLYGLRSSITVDGTFEASKLIPVLREKLNLPSGDQVENAL